MRRKHGYLIGCTVVLAVLALAPLLPGVAVLAQDDPIISIGQDVEMQVDFGFGGRFRAGYWTPVRITLINHGLARQTTISVVTRHGSPLSSLSHTTTYQQGVYLPASVPVSVELYPLISGSFHPLRVELHDDTTGQSLALTTLDLQRRAVTGDLIVALDTTGQEWSWLPAQLGTYIGPRGQLEGLHIAYVEAPGLLPSSWIAYHGVSAIAISASFPLGTLSQDQTSAIAQWTDGGGALVWAGGHHTQAARSPLAQSHLPLQLTGTTRRLPAGSTPSRYGPIPNAADAIVWEGLSEQALILSQIDHIPLVSRKTHGKGYSLLIAFDPNVLIRSGWNGIGDLARDVMLQAAPYSVGLGDAQSAVWSYIRGARLPYPSRYLPAALALGFTVLLALGLWVAKRRSKGTLLPVTIIVAVSAISVGTSVAVLKPVTDRSSHGVYELTITTVDPMGYGERWTFHGIRSIHRNEWQVEQVPDGWTQSPAQIVSIDTNEPNLAVRSDGDTTIASIPAETVGRFQAVEPTDLALEARLTLQSREYRLNVSNKTSETIPFVYYITPAHFAYLGPLAPAEATRHTYAVGGLSSALPSAEWMGTAIYNDLKGRMGTRADENLIELIRALVVQRQRRGSGGPGPDDGFLIGIAQAEPSAVFHPSATTRSTHIFLRDVALSGSLQGLGG